MIAWIDRAGIEVGTFPVLDALAPECKVYITTRSGGVSTGRFESLNLGEGVGDRRRNIIQNRRKLYASLQINPYAVARAVQVHGARIEVVTRGGVYRGVDGFVTSARGLTLVVNTADCFPLVIYAPSEKVLATLHAGWSGASLGIVPKAFEILNGRFSINTGHTIGLIGPGICKNCYTVPKARSERFPEQFKKRGKSGWHLDLLSYCIEQLTSCGLERRNIFSANLCTSCDPELFFSHRRDGGHTGRQWTLATIERSPQPV
ncbi:MAG: laccase domain-containing protein [bacterium]|nr:MAG: laccase domain-containing protein [bacterium]